MVADGREKTATSLRHPGDVKNEGFHCKDCDVRSKFWAPQIRKPLEFLLKMTEEIQRMEGDSGGLVYAALYGVGKAPSRFRLRHDECDVVVIEESDETTAIDFEEMGEDDDA